MQAQTARDLKETWLKVRRIHSAVNNLSAVASKEDTTRSYSDSVFVRVELSQIEMHDSVATQPAKENAMEIPLWKPLMIVEVCLQVLMLFQSI